METGSQGQTSSTSNAGGAPTKALNSAASTAHDVVDRFGAPLEGALDKAKQAAHGAVDKAVTATKPVARWVEQKEQYAEEQLKGTTEYVAANPIRALAIAFVAGVIFGRIVL